jgi:hypothetical protein
LQSSTELIIFDAGAGTSAANAAIWHASNYVLLVTRSQPVSITDTYATLKTAALQMALPGVGVVCNQSGVDRVAFPTRVSLPEKQRQRRGFIRTPRYEMHLRQFPRVCGKKSTRLRPSKAAVVRQLNELPRWCRPSGALVRRRVSE